MPRLSGVGWAVVFVLGLILVALELFVFPGTFIAGVSGAGLMLVALVMAMVDRYPGGPSLPMLPQLSLPLRDISLAIIVSFVFALVGGLPRSCITYDFLRLLMFP